MDAPSLNDAMEAERQRLTTKLEDIAVRRTQLDQEETAVQNELAGIQAYFDVKLNGVMTRPTVRTAKKGAPRGPRKAGLKTRVLEVITAEGISKQDIIAKLNGQDDKSMQQAISNALVALKKDEKIVSGERGSYKLKPVEAVKDTTPRRVKKEEAPAT